jgi:hypothetical protein
MIDADNKKSTIPTQVKVENGKDVPTDEIDY